MPSLEDDRTSPTLDDPSVHPGRGARVEDRLLAGRYRLGPVIARGAMGVVHRATDEALEREVAIKVLERDGVVARARFAEEALVTAGLQHPGIVPIHEIGQLEDGRPYYAMKLVSGRTLVEAAAQATTTDARLALVPAVLAVADAVGYAHSRGVIHRDLKPHNVLVGEFGEIVVIDWGIAKAVAAPTTSDGDVSEDERARNEGLTLAGSVLGTPAYMPPEQAAGEAVDTRADVYAIGAMLYHVLTGAPPYRGGSAEAVCLAVLEQAPPPLPTRSPDLPADLVAIVNRAMARAAADRYPSARELAADLRRFTTGQLVAAHRYTFAQRVQRFVRRNRLAVGVAAVAITSAAVGGTIAIERILHERDIATARRAEAEAAEDRERTQRAAAEDLVGFMLSDLSEKLEPVGKLELLEDVGQQVEAYYDVLPQESEDDTARAHRRVARMRTANALGAAGKLAEAEEILRAVLEEAEAAGQPLHAAEAAFRLSTIAVERGDVETSEAMARRAEALAGNADDPYFRAQALTMRAQLADRSGRRSEQLQLAEAAVEAARAVSSDRTSEHGRALLLAGALYRRSRGYRGNGEFDRARADLDEAEAASTRALEASPESMSALERQLTIRGELIDLLHQIGDDAAAEPMIDTALTQAERAARERPDALTWQYRVIGIARSGAQVARELGRHELALARLQHGRQAAEHLSTLTPESMDPQFSLARIDSDIADILKTLGRVEEGVLSRKQALERAAGLAERSGEQANVVMLHLRCRLGLVHDLYALHRDAEAREHEGVVRASAAKLIELAPEDASAAEMSARAFVTLAEHARAPEQRPRDASHALAILTPREMWLPQSARPVRDRALELGGKPP